MSELVLYERTMPLNGPLQERIDAEEGQRVLFAESGIRAVVKAIAKDASGEPRALICEGSGGMFIAEMRGLTEVPPRPA